MSAPSQTDVIEKLKSVNISAYVDSVKTGESAAFTNEVISTHCSCLILGDQYVLKVKRDIKYHYLDMSSLEKRRLLCLRELELNQRQLPDVYLDVIPIIIDQHSGNLLLGEQEADDIVVEWALIMVRFNEHHVFNQIANDNKLTSALSFQLGDSINEYHQELGSVPAFDGASRVREVVEELDNVLSTFTDVIDHRLARNLISLLSGNLHEHQALIDQRGIDGYVKRCHGDLHLRNILYHKGKPVPFDALEFDDRLATTDVLYDMAFLLSDVLNRDLHQEANCILNGYIRGLPHTDLDGLELLPLYIAIRTTILAMTGLQMDAVSSGSKLPASDHEATLTRAMAQLKRYSSAVVAIGGFSGTGKSCVSREVAWNLGSPWGAAVINSDHERKRIAGVDAFDKLPEESYTDESFRDNYLELMERCGHLIRAQQSVVVDATFLDEYYRKVLREIVEESGSQFIGIWLDAKPYVLKSRINARVNDVSDADTSVLDRQLKMSSIPSRDEGWVFVDANGLLDSVVENVLVEIKSQIPALQSSTCNYA